MPTRSVCTDLLEERLRGPSVAFGRQHSCLRNREHLPIGVCDLCMNRERAIDLLASRLRLSLHHKTAREDLVGGWKPDAHVFGRQLFQALDRIARL
jgi:hypothetical protein